MVKIKWFMTTAAETAGKALLGFVTDVLQQWANATATKLYNAPKIAKMFVTARRQWKIAYWNTMKEHLPGIATPEAEDRDIREKEEKGIFDEIYREELSKILKRRWLNKRKPG